MFQNQISKLITLHRDAQKHYEQCAFITTEKDLKGLFSNLANHRQIMCRELEELGTPRKEHRKTFRSFFQRIWKKVVVALIVNNRKKLLIFCRTSEEKIAKDYLRLFQLEELNEESFRIIGLHQQLIQKALNAIENTPTLSMNLHKCKVVV